MKKLLATTAVLAVLAAPASAGTLADKGAAAIMVYSSVCDINDIPASVLANVATYLETRLDEVRDEAKSTMRTIYSIQNLDKKTAENMWCHLMRPKLLDNFSKNSIDDAPEPPPVPTLKADKRASATFAATAAATDAATAGKTADSAANSTSAAARSAQLSPCRD